MNNPVFQRELIATLRTPRALVLLIGVGVLFAGLIVLRWPTDDLVDLSGEQSRQVFRLFSYALLSSTVLLVPVFPATSIVRERNQGTLALLFNSPLSGPAIYLGKLAATMVFVLLLLTMSVPAAAACYAMGGVSLFEQIVLLYGVLLLASLQLSTLGLLVSSRVNSNDAALRITYAAVLLLTVMTLGPHLFLQGQSGDLPQLAAWLRCVSPLPAVMEITGQADVGSQGFVTGAGAAAHYACFALGTSLLFAVGTLLRLNYSIFDQAHDAGVITDDRGLAQRLFRRLFFVVDPQRRSRGISRLVNPVMIKEFRTRRFGRSHWTLRLIALCALVSLGLTYASSTGTMTWGTGTIGGIMVLLQIALIILLTPALAAGLISSEVQSGSWQLMQMTPLSAGVIVRGKLLSVSLTLLLILLASLPGYAVMVWIEPGLRFQVTRVLICLGWTAVLAVLLSAAVSSLFRRTAAATTVAYAILIGLCAGSMLVWLGRDNPFGHQTVETVLKANPLAAALNVMEVRGFTQYNLVPDNWWIMGTASAACLLVLLVRVWQLRRPQ